MQVLDAHVYPHALYIYCSFFVKLEFFGVPCAVCREHVSLMYRYDCTYCMFMLMYSYGFLYCIYCNSVIV